MKLEPAQYGPRERVLEAADRLFYEQGYTNTGINQIIAEAAVAKASFYHHFPSKKDLVVTYLKNRDRAWFSRLHKTVRAEVNTRKKILCLFDFLETWLLGVDFRGCAFINITSETPALDAQIHAQVTEHKAKLRAYIHKLVASFYGDPGDGIGDIADTVFLLFEGAIVETQVMRELWPVRAAREATIRLLDHQQEKRLC